MSEATIVSPFPERFRPPTTLAAVRKGTLIRSIGLLDNRKGTADLLLSEAGNVLQAALPSGTRFVSRRKDNFSLPARGAVLDAMRTMDLVVTAVGD